MKHVVIVGAGGAGLCLLEQLLRQIKSPIRITMVDADPATHRHRTWCSWLPTEGAEPYHSAIWKNIRVSAPGYDQAHHPRHLVYAHASGSDYHAYVSGLNDGRHQIEWIHDAATGFGYDGPGLAHVYLGKTRITCDWVFTSWFPGRPNKASLWQHFHGWVIETAEPVFDADTMTLMDFDVPQHPSGVVFGYVLPFSSTQALIEITCFSPSTWSREEYERRLAEHMRLRFGLESEAYTIRNRETGSIPMDAIPFPGQPNPATFPIGTIAGAVKPSTGYAFARMRHTSRHLIETLKREGRPRYPSPAPTRFALYDALLLRIFRERPDSGVPIFTALFRRVPIDTVFRFLDEKTTLREEIGIFRRLPLLPFLRSLWKHATS